MIEKFLNITRIKFSMSNIFGKNVITIKTQPNYDQHVLPLRKLQCPKCMAWVWNDEKTGGSKNKLLFSL